jgi:hypothetical protein
MRRAATERTLHQRRGQARMARSNIQYLDLPMFVQLCPQCASQMTIRSIAAVQQTPTYAAIAYECVECNKDITRTVDRESEHCQAILNQWRFDRRLYRHVT